MQRSSCLAVMVLGTLLWAVPAHANRVDGDGNLIIDSGGAQMIRGRIGAGLLGLSDIAGSPDREAWALSARAETGLSTLLTDGSPGLTFYDAFYAGVDIGWLRSDPLSFLTEEEGKMSYGLSAGYLIMAGWRFGPNGVFVGVQPSLTQLLVGDSSVNLQTSMPLALRADYDLFSGNHLLGTAWFGGSGALGVTVELAFSGPVSRGIYVSYSQLEHDEVDAANQLDTLASGATASMFTLGYRVGSWR